MEQSGEEQAIGQPLEEQAMEQSSVRLLEGQNIVHMVEPEEKVIVEQVVEIESMNQPMPQHQIIIEESPMEQITMAIHDRENVGESQLHEHLLVGQTSSGMSQMQTPVTVDEPVQNVMIIEQPGKNVEVDPSYQVVPINKEQENELIDQPCENVTINPQEENVVMDLPCQTLTSQAYENVAITQPSKNGTLNQPCDGVAMNQPQDNITVNQPRQNVSLNQLGENVMMNEPQENVTINQPPKDHPHEHLEQQHKNITIGLSDQQSENMIIDQSHENITIDQSDQQSENMLIDQSHKNITIDQSDQLSENMIVDRPHKNIAMDQPRENITICQSPEKVTKNQPSQNIRKGQSSSPEGVTKDQLCEYVPVNRPQGNTVTDQVNENLTTGQSRKNVSVDLPSETIPKDQQPENEAIDHLYQTKSDDVISEKPQQTVAKLAQSSETISMTEHFLHVVLTRSKTDKEDEVTTLSQEQEKESMHILQNLLDTNKQHENSSGDQSQMKPVLVFCKTCGNRKLCDVTEQLQKLFTERTLNPNTCGICQEPVEQENIKCNQLSIKTEFDDDDYEEIKFSDLKNIFKTTSVIDDQKQIGVKTGKKQRESTRQINSISKPSRITTANKNETSISGKESDSSSNSTDSDKEEEDMMICEDPEKNKTEENYEEETSGRCSIKPDMKDRKFMDPELVKYLAPCDGANSDFVCKICQESCKFIGFFAKHISRHTNKKPIQKPYRCHECKENFEVRGFRKHFQRHHFKPYQCTECQFSFKSERDLKGHSEYHQGTRSNYCDVCGLAFISKLDLTKHMANHGGSRKHKCEYCSKVYNHIVKLREHKRKMHKEKKIACTICPFTCFTTEELENHFKIHSQDQLKCENCHHVFASQFVFDFHIQIHSCKAPEEFADDKSKLNIDVDIADILEIINPKLVKHMTKPGSADDPFRCKYCTNKDFNSAKVFLNHLEQCHPTADIPDDKLFHCNLCSRQYDRKCQLIKHMRSHSDNRPYECVYTNCNKAYKRRDLLNRHHEAHVAAGDTLLVTKLTDNEVQEILQQLHPQFLDLIAIPEDKDQPFTCKFCDVKQFKSANMCLNHIKQKHPEIKCPMHAYKCDQCDQTFEMKAALQRHFLIHSEYRPFLCTFEGCKRFKKGFKRKDKLKAHLEMHTSGGKRHMCCICGMWFSSKSGLKKHTNNVHLKIHEYKCSFCGKAFPIKWRKDHHEKTKHLGLREWVCELCGKSYNKRVELTQHMYYHSGKKPYACDYCEYRCVRLDYLKKHVKTHSKDRPYKCSVCSEQFLLRDTLIIHMKKYHGLTSPDKLSKIEKLDIPLVIKKRKLDSNISNVPQESQSYVQMTSAAAAAFPSSSGEHVVYESKPNVHIPAELSYQAVSFPPPSNMQ